ncbi:MAG: S-methyl-5-thioribose-1-phosphate isomerase [Armatimonadota bacterium]|nr:MAG: S-methyl-5-thioribose-1-phosphate isomerase [Armatimonadota bacterium]
MTPIEWHDDHVSILDQTRLPGQVAHLEARQPQDVADAICSMSIRGAPALGVAASFAAALAAVNARSLDLERARANVDQAIALIRSTRPTARNLFWALERMQACAASARDANELAESLVREALAVQQEDLESCRSIGDFGARLVPEGATILTHCNAGALATAGYGTALGVIRSAHRAGKNIRVLVDETRPLLQGARLTAWELVGEGIPATVIADSAAGWCMQQGMVNLVVVGADRIAANGDAANKIGTYALAVLACQHGIPFYIAAPMSTVDLTLAGGQDIPIEERAAEEVSTIAGTRVTPEGAAIFNPAFDVTPHGLITAIITDRGVCDHPLSESLAKLAS